MQEQVPADHLEYNFGKCEIRNRNFETNQKNECRKTKHSDSNGYKATYIQAVWSHCFEFLISIFVFVSKF